MSIGDNSISGLLYNVTGYTEFSGDTAEQSGHYLALKWTATGDLKTKLEATPAEASVLVELVNGSVGHPVALDADMNMVIRVTDKEHQSIKVYVTIGDDTHVIGEYSLNKLVMKA